MQNKEMQVKNLISDLIIEVESGAKDYNTAKKEAYTSFMAAKSFMSLRNTVVLTTFPRPRPACSKMALQLSSERFVCSVTPPGNAPVAGSMGS